MDGIYVDEEQRPREIYGSLMTSLTTQFSMGTNQYPEDVLTAVDILTNHRIDKREPK
jgi:hypothetical protein